MRFGKFLGLAAGAVLSLLASTVYSAERHEKAGWIYLRLEGSPSQIGFDHGRLLAPEIDDFIKTEKLYMKHSTGQGWSFYRHAAKTYLWPHVDAEYKQEIAGIARGLRSRGYHYDTVDLLTHNAWIELAWYYEPMWEANHKKTALISRAPESCSAFIATGKQTKDGKIVMAHNAWIDYLIGERWNAILDIRPTHGHRILMDAIPGFIHSGDDFGVNSSGIMVTETTITGAVGFDVNGIPEFQRMRKALQYSDNLGQFYGYMTTGNNGGYANTWLVGDTKTNEIGELELALRNVVFKRAKNGVFVSANFPQDPKLIAEDCTVNANQGSNPCADRHVRWNQLMKQYMGKVDARTAERFLGDHHDSVLDKDGPTSSTLCGHWDLETRKGFLAPSPDFDPLGSVQGKVITADLANRMSFLARMGHPCGQPFHAKPFLAAHPEYKWELPYLKDMPARPWALFQAP